MKKTLKATLCLALAVMFGLFAPILTALIPQSSARGLPDGLEDAYLPEEEDDFSGLAADPATLGFDLGVQNRNSSLAYSASGYTTHTSAGSIFAKVTNKTLYNKTCTAMQGMNVGTTYVYTAKIKGDNTATAIVRTNANTGAQVVMSYYASLNATSPSSCNSLGHANELTVVSRTENGKTVNYLYVITCTEGYPSLARLKIDGTKLYFTGYFQFKKTNGTSFMGGGVRGVRHAGGYFYFLVKSGMSFYTCRIPDGAKGGSKSSPTNVTCYRAFTIDTRNAVFVSKSNKISTVDGIDEWINQGFGYSSDQKTIYVPIFSGTNDNAILIYNVADYMTAAKLDANKDCSDVLFPSVETLRISDTSQKLFEIESCGFRTSQGTSGDLRLYFNTNATSSAKEGVWRIDSFKRKSSAPASMVNADSIIYTVKYNANGSGSTGSTATTYHIRGISVKLRKNGFARSGYTFIGWNLTRKSDGKWLYFTADGSAKWYAKGSQPATARLAVYEDGRKVSALTGVNGDIVTCYAQWRPNSTGTKSYYIHYDANGGSGTMADTKVVYGTSTAIRANAFTRSGYTFSGWHAYRMSDNSWIYTNNTTGADKWIPVGESTAGYTLKVYSDGCKVARTSSTDRDLVTFYAVWKSK